MELKKSIRAGTKSLKLKLIIFIYFSLFSIAFSQSNLEGAYTDIKILDKISSKNILLKLKNKRKKITNKTINIQRDEENDFEKLNQELLDFCEENC